MVFDWYGYKYNARINRMQIFIAFFNAQCEKSAFCTQKDIAYGIMEPQAMKYTYRFTYIIYMSADGFHAEGRSTGGIDSEGDTDVATDEARAVDFAPERKNAHGAIVG